jgi:hypothetical protein
LKQIRPISLPPIGAGLSEAGKKAVGVAAFLVFSGLWR